MAPGFRKTWGKLPGKLQENYKESGANRERNASGKLGGKFQESVSCSVSGSAPPFLFHKGRATLPSPGFRRGETLP